MLRSASKLLESSVLSSYEGICVRSWLKYSRSIDVLVLNFERLCVIIGSSVCVWLSFRRLSDRLCISSEVLSRSAAKLLCESGELHWSASVVSRAESPLLGEKYSARKRRFAETAVVISLRF